MSRNLRDYAVYATDAEEYVKNMLTPAAQIATKGADFGSAAIVTQEVLKNLGFRTSPSAIHEILIHMAEVYDEERTTALHNYYVSNLSNSDYIVVSAIVDAHGVNAVADLLEGKEPSFYNPLIPLFVWVRSVLGKDTDQKDTNETETSVEEFEEKLNNTANQLFSQIKSSPTGSIFLAKRSEEDDRDRGGRRNR